MHRTVTAGTTVKPTTVEMVITIETTTTATTGIVTTVITITGRTIAITAATETEIRVIALPTIKVTKTA